jgi:malonate transporter
LLNTILLALVPVFVVLCLGYGAGKYRVVDNGNVDSLNALVMEFALPAALFVGTASATRQQMVEQASLFALLSGIMLVVFLGWYLAVRRLARASSADAALQALTIAFPNLAGVGLPIAMDLLGPSGTVPIAVALAAGSIIISPLALILVELSTPASANPGGSALGGVARALGRSLAKPVVLAPALGILVSLAGIELGGVVRATLLLIGDTAAGVALFLTGLVLSAQPFRMNRTVAGATVASNVVRPLLALAAVALLPLPADVARALVLIAAVPSGFFGILFGISYRQDPGTLGSIVTSTTVASIVTLPVVIAFLLPG